MVPKELYGKRIKKGQRFGRLTAVSDSGDRDKGLVVWNLKCDCGRMIRMNSHDLRLGKRTDCGCVTQVTARQKDISGQIFGRLTAVSPTAKRTDKGTVWSCLCACGNQVEVPIGKLTNGQKTSCGCLGRGGVEDLTGLRVGSLTVLSFLGRVGSSPKMWHCRCDCGRELDVPARKLITGAKRHCGCLAPNRNTDLTGLVFGSLTVLSPAGKVGSRNCWRCRCACGREVIVPGASLRNGMKKTCGDTMCDA